MPVSIFWNNNNSGQWQVPINWQPMLVPNNNSMFTFNVTIDRGPMFNPTITLNLPPVTIDSLFNAEQVVINQGGSLTILNESLNAPPMGTTGGTLRANGPGNMLGISFLENGGTIVVNPASTLTIAPSLPPPIQSSLTHSGQMTIGDGSVLVFSGGTFDHQPSGVVATGMTDAIATLAIVDSFYNWQGGLVSVPFWDLTHSTLFLAAPAPLQIPPQQTLRLNEATISPVVPGVPLLNSGTIRVLAPSETMLQLPLSQVMSAVTEVEAGATLRFTASSQLEGIVRVADAAEVGLDATLVFGPGLVNTFSAAALEAIAGDLTLIHEDPGSVYSNTGSVTVAGPQEFTLDGGALTSTGVTVANAGTLRVQGEGVMELANGSVTGDGGLEVLGGTFRLDNSTAVFDSPICVISGIIADSAVELVNGSTATFGANAGIVVGSRISVDGSVMNCDSPICVINGIVADSMIELTSSSTLDLDAAAKLESEGELNVSGGSDVTGDGELVLIDGAEGIQNGSLVCSGAGSTILAGDVTLEQQATITVSSMASVGSKGDFSFAMVNEANWSWSSDSQMRLTGGVGVSEPDIGNYAKLEVGGTDLGDVPPGFVNNFDLPTLSIGPGAHVTLADCIDNGNQAGGAPEALYVDTLVFENAAGRLNLNGLNLYVTTIVGNPAQIIDILGPCGAAASPVGIASANPPTAAANPLELGQPYRDVLDTGTTNMLTAGIGGAGTVNQGAIQYSPILVTFTGTPVPALTVTNIAVSATGGVLPAVIGLSGSAAGPYSITFDRPIPPGHCTTITFTGPAFNPGTRVQYRSQPGNAGLDNLTNTQDLLAIITALNNGTANVGNNVARYNINRIGVVNTQDLLRVVQLLNGANTTQPFNGAGVAACP